MILEIKGYYGHDVHLINVDAIESISYASPRHNGNSDHRTLDIQFKNRNLSIDFLSYVDRGRLEYDKLVDAMRANHKQFVYHCEQKDATNGRA